MANAICFTSVNSFSSPIRPGITNGSEVPKLLSVDVTGARTVKFPNLRVKATESNKTFRGTKPNSIVCAECDGNGAKLCTQCQGSGVNSVDHFNGQFKAGGLCWLCRGKREILCGNCNGAGFVGGFMSTYDE